MALCAVSNVDISGDSYNNDNTSDQTERQTEALKQLEKKFAALQLLEIETQSLIKTLSERPKEIGFPWEGGAPEDHVKVDDGLNTPYYVPIDLCRTPKVQQKASDKTDSANQT